MTVLGIDCKRTAREFEDDAWLPLACCADPLRSATRSDPEGHGRRCGTWCGTAPTRLGQEAHSRAVDIYWRFPMQIRTTVAAAALALTLVAATGCAVSRGQETTGAYIDDSAITASVKTRMLDDARVAGTSITVETLNGTVMLSGFAKTEAEKAAAESIARKVDGVRSVKNEIAVRPAA
jgi:hyperosmotically inducible periplasmic protein